MEKLKFGGTARINIHFINRLMWQKYRRYILKTEWDFDSEMYPSTANLDVEFHSMDDVMDICRKIVYLLQLGFEIYSCRWKLDTEYLDEMTADPNENGDLSEREFIDLWEGYKRTGNYIFEG